MNAGHMEALAWRGVRCLAWRTSPLACRPSPLACGACAACPRWRALPACLASSPPLPACLPASLPPCLPAWRAVASSPELASLERKGPMPGRHGAVSGRREGGPYSAAIGSAGLPAPIAAARAATDGAR